MAASEAVKQIQYLAAALKAPRITEAAARLADHARDAGWTHEDYLAAVLEREVSARNASGAELRIRAAGFPARKTLEDFGWDAQPAMRQQIAALASGAFLSERRNVVLLGPPGGGKTATLAKLAARGLLAGHEVRVLSADAGRAGGVAQLEAFTRLLECPLDVVETPAALAGALARTAPGVLCLIDTPGTNPFARE